MKAFIVALLLFVPMQTSASDVLATAKVAHVTGVIDEDSKTAFLKEMADTADLAGGRLVVIDSPGGSVAAGQEMIDAIDAEKDAGIKITCVVKEVAASMAFNLLTHCDVRIADAKAILLFHKIEIGGSIPGVRMTARNLRRIAEQLDGYDEPYRQANAKALGMTIEEYDWYADHETFWEPSVLARLGYLTGIIKL